VIFTFRRPKSGSESLWDSYLEALELAHKTCKPVDWVLAGEAWQAWRAEYAKEWWSGLISEAKANSSGKVIDLTKILRG